MRALRSRVRHASAALALGLYSWSAQAAVDACVTPLFEDNFNGPTLDMSTWLSIEGDGCEQGICGWGNNELQRYSSENLSIVDGALVIRADRLQSGQYVSAKISSVGRFARQFGRFEARMKLPKGRGLWPAFWMLPEGSGNPWPVDGEINILEATGDMPERVLGAAHFGSWPTHTHYSETIRMVKPLSDDFHVYAVEWTPGKLSWSVDDKVFGVLTPVDIQPWEWVFDRMPFHLIFNLAVGGTLGGEVDDSIFPAQLVVDYVRVYDIACEAQID